MTRSYIRPARSLGALLLIGLLIAVLSGSPFGTLVKAQTGTGSTPIPPNAPTAVFGQAIAPPIAPPASADVVNAIARNLYCPVCANTPLDVCPTTACISWRAQIADLIGQGNNENQIQQYFIDHFGMRTVAIPTDPMSRVLVLGLPYVLIGLALLVILAQLWRWRHTRRIIAPAGGSVADGAIDPIDPAVLDEYQTRFEAEIKDDRR